MILKLRKGLIYLVPMKVPESIEDIYVKYDFELNTNHLRPQLIIEEETIYDGNRIFIDTRKYVYQDVLRIQVLLYNTNEQVVKAYAGILPFHKYTVFGAKLVRPDVEAYIRTLEEQIEKLETEGEVV
jgi:hypothetical protein